MKESKWAKDILQPSLQKVVSAMGDESLQVFGEKKLTYLNCVARYGKDNKLQQSDMHSYETDLLITETFADLSWCPRVLIETKLENLTANDAFTFSQKAGAHKNVHPYMRYGILIGAFEGQLPGWLVVHGGNFDFVIVWKKTNPDAKETEQTINIIREEIEASRQLEDLIKAKVKKGKKAVYSLHRKLELKS